MDRRAREIFLRALEFGLPARDAFVHRECGEDTALRELVSDLIRHHGEETILEISAPRSTSTLRRSSVGLRPVLAGLYLIGGTRGRRVALAIVCLGAFVALAWSVRQAAHQAAADQVYSSLAGLEASNTSSLHQVIAEWVRVNETAVAEGPAQQAALAVIRHPVPANWNHFDIFARHTLVGGPYSSYVMTDGDGTILPGSLPRFAKLIPSEYGAALLARIVSTRKTLIRILGTHRALTGQPGEGTLIPQVILCTPVFGPRGRLAGVFVSIRPLETLSQVVVRARILNSGESYLFSRDGVMLTPGRFMADAARWGLLHKPAVDLGSPYLEIRDPGAPLRLKESRGKKEDPETWPLTLPVRAAVAASANSSRPAAGQIREPYRDYRGELVVGSWRWLPELDTGFVSEVDIAEFNTVSGLFDRLLGVLLVLVAAGGIWAFLSSGWMLRMRKEIVRSGEMGQYTLLEKIGEGGMGEVYLARHPLLKRLSALKLLRRDRIDTASQAMFENEVQVASRLIHPNTVEIYDFGKARDGTFYYVMQYLPGRDLGDLISREGHMQAARVVHIARQITGALAEAHAEGLLHGDVKPGNVMLCCLGGMYDVAKLLDFGIARPIKADAYGHTLQAQSGTPYYTAPERLSGEGTPDGRADVYSFGVLCYYLLSGQMPQPPGIPWAEAVLTRAPLRLARLAPVPEDLEALIMSCIDPDPAGRPASALELCSQFDRMAATLPWSADEARAAWRAADLE